MTDNPKPHPSLRARRAAAALATCPSYSALIWWVDGDSHARRDSSGAWLWYDAPISPTEQVAQDLEKVWSIAVRIETLFPEDKS